MNGKIEQVPSVLSTISSGVFVSISKNDSIIARSGDLFTTLSLPEAIRSFTKVIMCPTHRGKLSTEDFDGAELSVTIAKPVEGISIPGADMGIYIRLGKKVGLLLPGELAELSPQRRMEVACLQAGIFSKGWNTPEADVHFFTVQVFSGTLPSLKK